MKSRNGKLDGNFSWRFDFFVAMPVTRTSQVDILRDSHFHRHYFPNDRAFVTTSTSREDTRQV